MIRSAQTDGHGSALRRDSPGDFAPGEPVDRVRGDVFLGENLLEWLLLALGGALAVGHMLALVRPREVGAAPGDLPRPPLARSILMIVVGTAVAVWSLASLIAG